MVAKPSLLYATAVAPASGGYGLAMRAGMVLDALREVFDVTVAMPGKTPAPDARYDVVHVFRIAALPLAKPYLERAGRRHLDLDDIESKTHRRIEALYRANGDLEGAERTRAASRRYELLEFAAFRSFDRVYVCSEADRAELTGRSKAEVLVLPNAVYLPYPAPPTPHRNPGEPFRFLFLGTMGYYPNFDGCLWFRGNVLPLLRRSAPGPFVAQIAGSGSAERLRERKSFRVLGEVPSVAPVYEEADAAIVPLRAGGGTRIKVLEAFSYCRPVVSTTIGAEGIAAEPGVDILIGDTAEEFADRCLELMRNRDLADRVAKNGRQLVEEAYSAEALKRVVAATFSS